jgi:hypothetical protein
MNVVGKIGLGLTAAALLGQAARADVAVASDYPYAGIAERNVFALLPPPKPEEINLKPVEPPPKITANGIMSIFGQLQALFKVAVPAKAGPPGLPGQPAQAGQPAHDQSYMLSEGQSQDDIEVVKIDEAAASITFKNHGVEQVIPLTPTQGAGGASGPGPISGGRNPFAPAGVSARRGGFGGGVGASGVNIPAPMPTPGAKSAVSAADIVAQETAGLTAEEQAILIEAERARLDTSEKPEYPSPMLPLTKFSPTEPGGAAAQSKP